MYFLEIFFLKRECVIESFKNVYRASLLNYVPFEPTCLTCLSVLRACVPSCLKLIGAYVPSCLKLIGAYVP